MILPKKGVGVIIISDDLHELIQNCNKILVMKNGKSSGILDASDLNETKLTGLLSGK